jgi:restriction system protein
VAWALAYLKQAGAVSSSRRGHYSITDRGRDLLRRHPQHIDNRILSEFSEFSAFRAPSGTDDPTSSHAPTEPTLQPESLTPDEQIRTGNQRLRESLATALLARLAAASPVFFEEMVVDLLVRMGYGGSRTDAAAVVGRSGDEGIDGIIKEDRLGLDTIYIQAKRWSSPVGRPEIQRFAGALQGQRARKGVLITTSRFSPEAREYAERLQSTIVLIDGAHLAQLMMDHGVGVSESDCIRILRIDEDYFADE